MLLFGQKQHFLLLIPDFIVNIPEHTIEKEDKNLLVEAFTDSVKGSAKFYTRNIFKEKVVQWNLS